tara:strand:+ start:225 stop:560 length:336 start_codon:yes stop_codon:yes gene_type:complete
MPSKKKSKKKIPTAIDIMENAIKTFNEREKVYGTRGYEQQGRVIKSLFPNGIKLETEEDHNRFFLLSMIIVKLCRYTNNLDKKGHKDSVHDMGVYSFILESFDASYKGKRK